MTIKPLAALFVLCAAACSGPAGDEGAAAAKDAEAAAAETNKAGYEIAVRCQASLDAVSRLYSALSNQSEGAEREEMGALAVERELAATNYRDIAQRVGAHIGHSKADIGKMIKAAHAAVQAEYDKRPFEDFAVWVGEEADRCPPPGRT